MIALSVSPGKAWRDRDGDGKRVDLDALAKNLRGRDYEILAGLLKGGFMTLDQVALLYCPTPKGVVVASQRMTKLFKAGLLESFRPSREGAGNRGGSARLIYCLDRPGATLAAAYMNKPLQDVWRPRDRFVQMAHVLHRLCTVDFWAATETWVRSAGGKLLEFEIEPRQREGKVTLAADALVTYQAPGAEAPKTLWVEIDRGTESVPRFLERMSAYDAFYKLTRNRYGDNLPGVLIVVDTGRFRLGDGPPQTAEQRLKALKVALDKAAPGWDFRRFKFAVMADLFEIPSSDWGSLPEVRVDLAAPVCWAAGREDRLRVF